MENHTALLQRLNVAEGFLLVQERLLKYQTMIFQSLALYHQSLYLSTYPHIYPQIYLDHGTMVRSM